MQPLQTPEFLDETVQAFRRGGDRQAALDALPVPAYATDAEGAVTYWNKACVDFAGREPELGSDRWCVTWQLYTISGEPLPHDECPMAEAIKTRREVRGKVAIAMRPDGSRRAFTPYPTPLFDEDGNLAGAINLLIDVSEEQAHVLDDQAARCRRLGQSMTDPNVSEMLSAMARNYAETAETLRPRPSESA